MSYKKHVQPRGERATRQPIPKHYRTQCAGCDEVKSCTNANKAWLCSACVREEAA